MSKSSREPGRIVLSVAGAIKRYGPLTALDGLDLELRGGEWRGLIGPNGAGKTTLMLAVAGLIGLDAGRVELLGRLLRGPRPDEVGWVPQEIALYPKLTARENLTVFGRLHGLRGAALVERVGWALEWTGLRPRADDRVARFSGGMKRRLNIVCGVLHRPRVVLLDEPTVGVDPQARERIFTMLAQLRDDGAALMQSSHELGDIEATCDSLTVMDRGRSIATGDIAALVRRTCGDTATLRLDIEGLSGGLGALEREPGTDRWRARLTNATDELPRLLDAIRRRDARVVGLEMRRPGLAEVFAELTGRDLRE